MASEAEVEAAARALAAVVGRDWIKMPDIKRARVQRRDRIRAVAALAAAERVRDEAFAREIHGFTDEQITEMREECTARVRAENGGRW